VKWVSKNIKRATQACPFLPVQSEHALVLHLRNQHRVDHMKSRHCCLDISAVTGGVSTFYTVSCVNRQ